MFRLNLLFSIRSLSIGPIPRSGTYCPRPARRHSFSGLYRRVAFRFSEFNFHFLSLTFTSSVSLSLRQFYFNFNFHFCHRYWCAILTFVTGTQVQDTHSCHPCYFNTTRYSQCLIISSCLPSLSKLLVSSSCPCGKGCCYGGR
jgi:hypothetical protein